jgi:hypothetical protein
MLRYVDETELPPFWKRLAMTTAPIAAILVPAAFFLSVVSPKASRISFIYLAMRIPLSRRKIDRGPTKSLALL